MNLNINAVDKKFNIILTISVSFIIILYLIIKLIPVIRSNYAGASDKISGVTEDYYYDIIIGYINERPDYYFGYDGAIYCISVQDLIKAGKVTEKNVGEYKDSIIEAKYFDGSYLLDYNNECVEK